MRLMRAVPILLASVTVSAQVPLPTALRDAQTVYVVNAGVHERILTNAVKHLPAGWTIVADASAADITLTLSAQPLKQVFNWATGQSYPINTSFLAITGKDGTALYGVQFVGNPEKELKKLATRLTE